MAFLTLTTSGGEPKTYELNKPRIVVGRDSRCDVHIDNLAISKQHCEFVHEGDAYILRDLNSSNKTFIGSEEIKEHKLKDGEEAILGPYRIKFTNPQNSPPRADIPTASDGFEPTLQLPPDMIRKKIAEMQAEKASASGGAAPKVMTAGDYAAAQSGGTAPPGDSKKSNMVAMIFIAAIVLVVVINVVVFVVFRK